jgi:hypothetical protein
MTSKRCAGAEMLYFEVTPEWSERVKDHAVARSAAALLNHSTLFEATIIQHHHYLHLQTDSEP